MVWTTENGSDKLSLRSHIYTHMICQKQIQYEHFHTWFLFPFLSIEDWQRCTSVCEWNERWTRAKKIFAEWANYNLRMLEWMHMPTHYSFHSLATTDLCCLPLSIRSLYSIHFAVCNVWIYFVSLCFLYLFPLLILLLLLLSQCEPPDMNAYRWASMACQVFWIDKSIFCNN